MADWKNSIDSLITQVISETNCNMHISFLIIGAGLASMNEPNNGVRLIDKNMYKIEAVERPILHAFSSVRKNLRMAAGKELRSSSTGIANMKAAETSLETLEDIIKQAKIENLSTIDLGFYLIGAGLALLVELDAPDNLDEPLVQAFLLTRLQLVKNARKSAE